MTETCTHCELPVTGAPVADEDIDGLFCCGGCLETYRIVMSLG